MKHTTPSQRFALAALALLAFVTLGLSIPIFVAGRPQSITLQSASVFAASRDQFDVSTPVRLADAPGLVLQRGTVTIATDRGRPLATGEAVAQLLAGGNARLVLEDATIVLETEKPAIASGTADGEPPVAPILVALSRLRFSTLSIRRGVLVLKRPGGGSEVMSDVRLEVVHKREASLSATGSFELQGRQLKLDATLGLTSDRKDVQRLPVKATIKGEFIEATIADGRVQLGDGLKLQAEQAEVQLHGLRKVAGWLGAAWPGERGLGPFRAKGQLEWVDRNITFQNASFKLDGNDAGGTLRLDWSKARPAIEGTLAIEHFDAARYLGPEKSGSSFMERTVLGWLRSATEPGSLSLPLIRHLDADLRISAKEVTVGAVRLGRSAASVAVKDQKLLADVAEVEIDGDGIVRGQLTIDMGGVVPRYVLRGKLEAVDAAKATTLAFGHPAIAGRSNIMFDLTGAGETIDHLANTFHGKLGIELPDGGAIGLDVPQLAALTSKATEIKGWGNPARGQVRVSHLVARFGMQAGVLMAETFKAVAGERLITVSGDVNLGTRSIDAKFSLARLVGGGVLTEPTVAAEPTEILAVRGPWAEPVARYSTRPSKAAAPAAPQGLPPGLPASIPGDAPGGTSPPGAPSGAPASAPSAAARQPG